MSRGRAALGVLSAVVLLLSVATSLWGTPVTPGEVFWFLVGGCTGVLSLMQAQTWSAHRQRARVRAQVLAVLESAAARGMVMCAQCDVVIFDPVEHGRLFHADRPVGPEDRS